jgi:hypothetical protein
MMRRVGFVVCTLIGYLLGHFLPAGAWSAYVPILVSYHLYLVWLVMIADHETGLSMPPVHAILTHSAFLAALIGLAMGRHFVPFFGVVRIFVPSLAPFECGMLFSGGRAKTKAAKEAVASQPVVVEVAAAQNAAAVEAVVEAPGAAQESAPNAVSSAAADVAAEAPEGPALTVEAPKAQRVGSLVVSTGMGFVEPDENYGGSDHDAWLRYLKQPRRAFKKPGQSVSDEFKQWLDARAQLRAIVAQNQIASGEVSKQA